MTPPVCRLHELVGCGEPGRPALTFRDTTLTYAELAEAVDAAAAGLVRLGVRPGDRVVVYLEKRIETVVAMLAVSAAGAVLVPANPVLKARQVEHVLADSGAAALITSTDRWTALRGDVAAVPRLVLLGETLDVSHAVAWDELCAPASTNRAVVRREPADAVSDQLVADEVAAFFYTSGSTGGPKGVVVTHANLVAGARTVAGYLEHTADDVILSVLPLSFDAGFSQLTTSFLSGAHVVLVNYLAPREVVRLCERHGVTGMTCVPPLWSQLAAQKWPEGSSRSLRYFASTGGPMPASVLARLREAFPGAAPFLMYGLTEAFRSTYLDPAEIDRKPGSIGKAVPGEQVVVVRDDGSECAPGEHGELVHRGHLVSLGYWHDEERTAARFRPWPRDGEIAVWSGDTVRRDEEGFLYFVGRSDDMIKTSGYRASPGEVEDAAYATGLVGEAVALGVADEVLGQQVVLAVTGVEGGRCDTDTLAKALRLELPAYLVPRRIESLDALPRSANGKFDRAELRRQLS